MLKFNTLKEIKQFTYFKKLMFITGLSLILGELLVLTMDYLPIYTGFIVDGLLVYYYMKWQWNFFDNPGDKNANI